MDGCWRRASGAVIFCAVTPTPTSASGGAPLRVALALAGSIAQPENTFVRVSAETWAEGQGAAVAAALSRLPPPTALLSNVTTAAATAVRAILGALTGTPPLLASNFTDAAAVAAVVGATLGESARAFAAVVRTRGVTIEGAATTFETAVASEPVGGGAVAGLAAGGTIGADSPVVGDAYFLSMASTAIGMIFALGGLYFYCKPSAPARSKHASSTTFQHVNPLARGAGRGLKKV